MITFLKSQSKVILMKLKCQMMSNKMKNLSSTTHLMSSQMITIVMIQSIKCLNGIKKRQTMTSLTIRIIMIHFLMIIDNYKST
jgi:hypothetical protein